MTKMPLKAKKKNWSHGAFLSFHDNFFIIIKSAYGQFGILINIKKIIA
jgi:hypothetical protein